MLLFGRSCNARYLPRAALIALGPIAFAGCGSDDEAPQSAASPPAAASPAGHGEAAPAGGHGAPAEHGAPAPVASTTAPAMHGAAPAGAHGHDAAASDSSAGAPDGSSAGAHAAHGTPGAATTAAFGAHGVPTAGSHAGPASSHDPAGQVAAAAPQPHGAPSGVPTSHDAGGPAPSGGAAAHGATAAPGAPMPVEGSSAGAAGGHGAPVASSDSSASGGHGQSEVPGVGAVDAGGAPAGHGQMPPGAAGAGTVPEGYAGSDIPGAAQPQQKFEEGTAEYAVQQLVLKMQSGNTEELDKLISDKTKDPILQPLVEGTADDELIQKNKELVSGASLTSRRESGSSKLFVVNNAGGKVLTFTARKDGEVYKVVSIRVETPRGLKARQQTGS